MQTVSSSDFRPVWNGTEQPVVRKAGDTQGLEGNIFNKMHSACVDFILLDDYEKPELCSRKENLV